MTPFQLAIWALLMALAPHTTDIDEPAGARSGRLAVTAVAIADATDGDIARAARVIALGEAESHFARYVMDGRCQDGPKGSRCDPLHGRAQSLGPWQQRRRACPRAWAAPLGSIEQLREQAKCADRLLRGASARCMRRGAVDPEAAGFAGYRGIDCEWSGGARRARRSIQLRARLAGLVGR